MKATTKDIDAEYRLLREECGLTRRDACFLTVDGPDAAEYLHSQVTNDVEALEPSQGCYACLLDRKGHIRADMRILRTPGDYFLVICDPAAAESLERHLTTYSIGRDVRITGTEEALISLEGPASGSICGPLPDEEHASTLSMIGGIESVVVRTPEGIDVITPASRVREATEAMLAAGALEVSPEASEALRVEAGIPRFGNELADGPMPAEAGLVDRAVSFTKGCYIGQEPVARLHYKGRPNRFLRGIRLAAPPAVGDRVQNADRELGRITSLAHSPREGWIALSILRREASPGDPVEVVTDFGTVEGEVIELPFQNAAQGMER